VRRNPVKRQLASGGKSFGTFAFEFVSEGLGRLTASAGADFLVLDLEHSGFSLERLRPVLLGSLAADPLVPIVRVPRPGDLHAIAAALDLGALGAMVPMLETVEQAEAIVAATRYPPQGSRGFGILFDDELTGDVAAYCREMSEEILVIGQIETRTALERVDKLAAVDGVDVLWVGHLDLSISLGIPGGFNDPRFTDALARVVAACETVGKAAGMNASSPGQGAELLKLGFRAIGYAHDIELYRDALRHGVSQLRAWAGPES
jgi:2-dehydro-3-deoxyglucarate aldolase/4-hydroxy-2-oxoheptanedioate aldolase